MLSKLKMCIKQIYWRGLLIGSILGTFIGFSIGTIAGFGGLILGAVVSFESGIFAKDEYDDTEVSPSVYVLLAGLFCFLLCIPFSILKGPGLQELILMGMMVFIVQVICILNVMYIRLVSFLIIGFIEAIFGRLGMAIVAMVIGLISAHMLSQVKDVLLEDNLLSSLVILSTCGALIGAITQCIIEKHQKGQLRQWLLNDS